MHRLFVAIDLPQSIKEHLKTLCFGLPGARWVKPEQLHLTLRFIGEVDGGVFHDIKQALFEIDVPQFSMQLDGLGCFPPRGRPRVLWTGIKPCPELIHLQKKIETVLTKQVGLSPEGRKYSPHIAIARTAKTPAPRVGRYIEEYGLYLSEPFTVDEFRLYSSFLGRNGAVHNVEQCYRSR